jgi:hypothetical protein
LTAHRSLSEENENKEFLSVHPEIEDYPHLFIFDETGKLVHSKDTSEREQKETGDLAKFAACLKEWIRPRP